MQDYIDMAAKNGVALLGSGKCQFCGATVTKGVNECLEIFSLGFQDIDLSITENQRYRFLLVDAHCLQHSEIHGRWNNHFHLSRLHLIFKYGIHWTYALSPKLSGFLNHYKAINADEHLSPPEAQKRGAMTSVSVLRATTNEKGRKQLISTWAMEVYQAWNRHHDLIDVLAKGFLDSNLDLSMYNTSQQQP